MKNQNYNQTSMEVSIKHYDSYFNCKRSKRSEHIMICALNTFVRNNELETPDQYLLYLIADKHLQSIRNGKDYVMIHELVIGMETDLYLFKPENYK